MIQLYCFFFFFFTVVQYIAAISPVGHASLAQIHEVRYSTVYVSESDRPVLLLELPQYPRAHKLLRNRPFRLY